MPESAGKFPSDEEGVEKYRCLNPEPPKMARLSSIFFVKRMTRNEVEFSDARRFINEEIFGM